MKEQKELKKSENRIHRVRFKKEPIWVKANFVGRYNGVKFRITYKEYMGEDIEGVMRNIKFNWPGRIPENKKYAEEGIKTLFLKELDAKNSDITMKVIDDVAAADDSAEINALRDEIIEGDPSLKEMVKKEYDADI